MIKTIRLFFQFVMARFEKKLKIGLLSTALMALLGNLLTIIIPLIQKNILDSISVLVFDKKLILILLVIGLLSVIIAIYEALIINGLCISLQNRLQKELLESSIRTNNKIIEARGAGAYMVSIFGDSEQISNLLGTNFFSLILICIFSIVILIIASTWSWVFAAVVIPSYIIMIVIMTVSNKLHMIRFKRFRELIMEINPKVLEYIENRKSVLGFADIRKYENELYDIFKSRDDNLRWATIADTFAKSAISATKNVALIVFFALSMLEILNGSLALSSFIAMVAYFSQIFLPISAIQNVYTAMNKFQILHNKVKDNLNVPVKLAIPENDSLVFDRCSFSYAEKNEGISKSINEFSLEVDKLIGLVGLSGEGKTTIIKILFGDVKPQEGNCFFGNSNSFDIPKEIIHSNILIYGQDSELFDNSMEFNITLGKLGLKSKEYDSKLKELESIILNLLKKIRSTEYNDLDSNEKEVIADLFLLDERILKKQFKDITDIFNERLCFLSNDLASNLVSRRFYITEKYNEIINDLELHYLDKRDFGQRGSKISGGEKNKICLARLLLPNYSKFYVIDEPFTSLDILSEKLCVRVLKKHIAGKKGIIISHKLDIIKELADEIVVLENGRISEQGSHTELDNSQGLYHKLFDEYINN